MTEGKYSFSAKKAGRNCEFVAAADAKEEVIKQAKMHATTCSVCAGLSDEQLNAAIEEKAQ